MDYTATGAQIVDLVGGPENVRDVAHCMTRLRFTLVDNDLAQVNDLRNVDGVVAAQIKSGQVQVIIGPDVVNVYSALPESVKTGTATPLSPGEGKGTTDESWLDKLIATLSAFFFPIAIAMAGAGLIKGIVAILVNTNLLSVDSDTYSVLNIIGDAVFYFMPFLLAASVSRRINTNIYLSLALAGMLMYPTLVNGAAAGEEPLRFLGIAVPHLSYASSVIPIIFAVLLLKVVYDFLDRFIPKSLELIITSALALFITGVVTLTVFGPLGTFVGHYLSAFFVWLYAWVGPVASMLLAAVFPLLVMTGMAYSFFPVVMNNLATLGYDFILLPIMVYANLNQGVAAWAVALKTKDPTTRSLAGSTGLTAILGITEPAMYTVNLRFRRPFYFVMIGNALAGLLSGIFAVKVFAMAGGGIFALPVFASVDFPSNIGFGLLALASGMVVTFVLTYLFTPRSILRNDVPDLVGTPAQS